jgi:hypothetical protein
MSGVDPHRTVSVRPVRKPSVRRAALLTVVLVVVVLGWAATATDEAAAVKPNAAQPVWMLVLGLFILVTLFTWAANLEADKAIFWVGGSLGVFAAAMELSFYLGEIEVPNQSRMTTIIGLVLFLAALVVMRFRYFAVKALRSWPRHQRVLAAARDTRWFGRPEHKLAYDDLLGELADLPSARFLGLTRTAEPFEVAVVCDTRLVAVAFTQWPDGVYNQLGGSFDIRRDGRPFDKGDEELSRSHAYIVGLRRRVPAAQAIVVISGSGVHGSGVVLETRGDDRVRLTSPAGFVALATELLRQGAYEIDIPTLTSALAETNFFA